MAIIKRGAEIKVRDAKSQLLVRVALTSVIDGRDFPVVWVCDHEEWKAAQDEQREPVGIPWPANAVVPTVSA
jgi:hypothetical protein